MTQNDYAALVSEARATVADGYDDSTSATQGPRRRVNLLRLADAVEDLQQRLSAMSIEWGTLYEATRDDEWIEAADSE